MEQAIISQSIKDVVQQQRSFFQSKKTIDISYRIEQLRKLKSLIEQYEDDFIQALHDDLRKNEFEAYATEIGFVLADINKTLNKLVKWAKPKRVHTPPFFYVASSYIVSEPYGNTLIISPWNYPFQLLLAPLVGALAAGNTAILKPSELAPATSVLVTKMINEHFPSSYIHVIEGAVEETKELLSYKFDYVFFTGSTRVGQIVYEAAAKHLTPVTLELGGKSPCIVDSETHLDYTAKRIVWGKFINMGQTCIAPDYILVNEEIKAAFIEKVAFYINKFYGEDPQQSDSLGRIINHSHFDRLVSYIHHGNVLVGGEYDRDEKYSAPTILDQVELDSPLMGEEIFGPILPIISYDKLGEAIDFINDKPKPLALYIFSTNNRTVDMLIKQTSSGGVAVNDTLMHIVNPNLPFGGVGDSGIGAYHGKSSFDLFSHKRSVLHRSFLIEEPIRYAPYKMKRSWLKKIMDWAL